MSEIRQRLRQWWMFNGYAVTTTGVFITLLLAALWGLLTLMHEQPASPGETHFITDREAWLDAVIAPEDR